ncbi:MAG: MATE family efflux transporter [Granulosicoccus sp.]
MNDTGLPGSPAAWRQRVLTLALPIMLSNATVPLVGVVDTAVMGRMSTPDFLSATAIGAVLFSSIFWAFGFLRMSTGGLVAQALGAGKLQSIRHISCRALLLAALIGICIIAMQSPLERLGLYAFDGTASMRSLSSDYFRVRILSAPATLMLYAVIGSLVGQQRMRDILLLQFVLNGLNILLTISFFQFTDWTIKGVAAASVISEYLALAFGLWLLREQLLPDKLSSGRRWRESTLVWLFDRTELQHFFSISGDIFIRTLCLTGAFYWLTVVGSRFGDATLAANAVLIQFVHFSAHALDGFAHAAESLAGYAHGLRQSQALRQAVRATSQTGIGIAVAFCLLYALLGELIVDALTTQSEVRNLSQDWLPWIIMAPLTGFASFILDGVFIGTTQTRAMRNAMLVSVAVFLISIELLTRLLGNHGLWLSYHVLMVARATTLGLKLPQLLR